MMFKKGWLLRDVRRAAKRLKIIEREYVKFRAHPSAPEGGSRTVLRRIGLAQTEKDMER